MDACVMVSVSIKQRDHGLTLVSVSCAQGVAREPPRCIPHRVRVRVRAGRQSGVQIIVYNSYFARRSGWQPLNLSQIEGSAQAPHSAPLTAAGAGGVTLFLTRSATGQDRPPVPRRP